MAVRFNPNIQAVLVANKQDNNSDQSTSVFNTEGKNVTTNTKTKEDAIKNKIQELFEPVFQKYNQQFNENNVLELLNHFDIKYNANEDLNINRLKHLAIIIDKAFEENYDKSTKTLDLNKAINTAKLYDNAMKSGISEEDLSNKPKDITSVINTQYAKSHNGKTLDMNAISKEDKEKYIKEYFESKLNDYLAKPNMTAEKAEQQLMIDFSLLLNNTSDKEKALLLDVALTVFKNSDAIKTLFDSFQDKTIAAEVANSVEYNKIKDLDGIKAEEIIKHLSKENLLKYLQEYDNDFKQYYDNNKEIVDRVIDKIEKGIELSKNEKKIKNELKRFSQLAAAFELGTVENENLTEQDKQDISYQIKTIVKQYPIYDMYVQCLAEYVKENQNELSISPDKLKEILDKATDGKFTEKFGKIPEKSSYDAESGNFKVIPTEKAAESEVKIQAIKQIIVENEVQQECSIDKQDPVIDFQTLSENGGISIIKDIFSGKIKISEFLEKTAIKQYKLLDIASQGQLLQSASGKFFNELIDNTKDSTLENLLATGWKGRSFASTQKVKETIEERKDDVA